MQTKKDMLEGIVSKPLRFAPLYWGVGFLAVLAVIFLSLTPTPPDSGLQFENADKLLHLLAYFCLCAWFGQLVRSEGALNGMALLLIVLGFTLEWAQGLGDVRRRELADAVANGVGVIFAWYLCRGPFASLLARIETKLAPGEPKTDSDSHP